MQCMDDWLYYMGASCMMVHVRDATAAVIIRSTMGDWFTTPYCTVPYSSLPAKYTRNIFNGLCQTVISSMAVMSTAALCTSTRLQEHKHKLSQGVKLVRCILFLWFKTSYLNNIQYMSLFPSIAFQENELSDPAFSCDCDSMLHIIKPEKSGRITQQTDSSKSILRPNFLYFTCRSTFRKSKSNLPR